MKNAIEFIKELRKKPYGKSVFFFGFYLIFFIVIFLIITFAGNDKLKDYEKNKDNYLDKYNYSYEYKVVLDNNTYIYTGNKENNTFKYVYNSKEYYNEGEKSYIKEDDWKEVENPIKFNKFFKESVIKEIIDSAYIESRTVYNNGNLIYNLLMSSNSLNKLLEGKDTDIEEVPNSIKLTKNSDGIITEINYSLDSYCKANSLGNSLNIIIIYKDFSRS